MLERNEIEGQFDPGVSIQNTTKFKKLDTIEKFAWYYKEFTDAIEKFSIKNKNDFMTIQYEKLLQNPNNTIQNILEFCDLSLPASLDDMPSLVQKNTVDKWKKTLSQKDIEKISNIVKNSTKQMKYNYNM